MSILGERDSSIDVAKALGIIFVVLGHTQFKYAQVIYQFHLPLFFFLSGAVFNKSKIFDVRKFAISKIKSLYLPFVKFELIFLVLHNVFSKIGFYSELSNVQLVYEGKDFIIMMVKILTMGGGEQLAGPLWFLISSFEIVFIFALLIMLCYKKEKYSDIFLLLISLVMFYVGCYSDFPRMLSQSFIGLFFFCMGFLYRKYKNKIRWSFSIAMISLIIILLCARFNFVDISLLKITHKWMLIVSGLAGSYFTIYIAKMITLKKNRVLQYIGKNTIYILALHCMAFKFVAIVEQCIYHFNMKYIGVFPTYEVNVWWFIPFTLTGIILPIVIKLMIDYFGLLWRKKQYGEKVN